MQIQKLQRSFRYCEGKSSAGALILPDPDPSLDVESVRTLLSTSYPEITTAALTGPETIGDKLVYTFSRSVGVKG
ncbi:MAG TPA: PRTRC system protein C [Bryobacteraceae bacterium]|jgi:PRTRC genetic system protein C